MSLISTIGSLATNDYSTLLGDLGESLKQAITGPKNNMVNINEYYLTDTNNNSCLFFDLRGRDCVFRGPNTAIWSNQHFLMGKNFYWYKTSFSGKLWELIKPKILKIKIHLFQPYEQSFLGQLKSQIIPKAKNALEKLKAADTGVEGLELSKQLVYETAKNVVNYIGGGLLISQALSKTPVLNEVAKIILKEQINLYSRNPSKLYDSTVGISLLLPFAAIQNMFVDGKWLNSYTIPLITKLYQYAYTDNCYSGLTGGGGLIALLGKTLMGSNEKANKIDKGMFKTIPSTPSFSQELKAKSAISTLFYLINENSEYTVRNYTFMQAFIAGTMPVHFKWGVTRPPNVYYVEILGKRLFVWAQIKVTVTEIGKYKKDLYATKKIASLTKAKLYKNSSTTEILWPLAWKLNVTITDFTPNTFNSYLHYLTNGSCLTSLKANSDNANSQIINFEEDNESDPEVEGL